LLCESLESRQLLSTTATTIPNLGQITAQPSIEMTPMAGGGSTALTPQQVRGAYGLNQVSLSGGIKGDGTGQTIAIVDAYNDPNIAADLAAFDKAYNLPAPPSFKVDNLGATTTDPGWALETALDVEWAHALAPGANIVLVEASSASMSSLYNAVTTASELPGVSVMSMSWGTNEYYGEWYNENVFTTPAGHSNETFIAASGDQGAWSGPTFPSVSPNVLAVGGTNLSVSGNSYNGEAGWTGSTGGFSGLDNGYRYSLAMPSYQAAALSAAGLNYGIRTTPDVSFNAGTGVAVYDSVSYSGQSGWFTVGGTSAAAPAWAGLVAVTDQGLALGGKGPLSTNQLQTQLYSLPSNAFHDVTGGFNGYHAGPGYDLVTGLGTPVANVLVPDLLAASGIKVSSPTAPAASSTSPQGGSGQHLVVVSSASNSSGTSSGVSGSATNPGAALPTGILAASATASTSTGQSLAALPAQGSGLLVSVSTPSTSQQTYSVMTSAATTAVPTSSLGQGLSGPSTPGRWTTKADTPSESLVDAVEAGLPGPSATPESSAPEATPAPAETPAPPSTVPDHPSEFPSIDRLEIRAVRPAANPASGAIDPIPDDRPQRPEDGDTSAAPRVLGAAAIAIGGYRFLSRPSARNRRRKTGWSLPGF
jgi:subtilase family serine protease